MPIIKSAQKRARQTIVRRERNLATKRKMRQEIKALEAAIAAEAGESALSEQLKKAQSAVDLAAKKNVIHKNKASRKKAQLHAAVKAVAATKPAKAATKKPAAKTTTKKAPAKPAAKTTKK